MLLSRERDARWRTRRTTKSSSRIHPLLYFIHPFHPSFMVQGFKDSWFTWLHFLADLTGLSDFFKHLEMQIYVLLSPVPFLSMALPVRAGNRGNRDPPATYPKNTGFRARERFHLRIPALPNCYTSQLLDDGWLTWWCGWRDGGNPGQTSSVTRMFF